MIQLNPPLKAKLLRKEALEKIALYQFFLTLYSHLEGHIIKTHRRKSYDKRLSITVQKIYEGSLLFSARTIRYIRAVLKEIANME